MRTVNVSTRIVPAFESSGRYILVLYFKDMPELKFKRGGIMYRQYADRLTQILVNEYKTLIEVCIYELTKSEKARYERAGWEVNERRR